MDSTGISAITNVGITNSGLIESTAGTLTIDPPVPGPTLTNSGTLEANGGELDIASNPIANTGTLQAIDDFILKLTTLTVTNTGNGTVTVGNGSTLDLVSATIDGGTLGNSGTLDSTGISAITNVGITNSGLIEFDRRHADHRSSGPGSDPDQLRYAGSQWRRTRHRQRPHRQHRDLAGDRRFHFEADHADGDQHRQRHGDGRQRLDAGPGERHHRWRHARQFRHAGFHRHQRHHQCRHHQLRADRIRPPAR